MSCNSQSPFIDALGRAATVNHGRANLGVIYVSSQGCKFNETAQRLYCTGVVLRTNTRTTLFLRALYRRGFTQEIRTTVFLRLLYRRGFTHTPAQQLKKVLTATNGKCDTNTL